MNICSSFVALFCWDYRYKILLTEWLKEQFYFLTVPEGEIHRQSVVGCFFIFIFPFVGCVFWACRSPYVLTCSCLCTFVSQSLPGTPERLIKVHCTRSNGTWSPLENLSFKHCHAQRCWGFWTLIFNFGEDAIQPVTIV